jgi:hypothetical protein
MRNCHELAQRMMKQAKKRRNRPGTSRSNYHANLLIEDSNGGKGYTDTPMDLFDATFNFFEMEKEVGG